MKWHCPPDTGFEIRALAVWGRARYLSVTEAPHNTDFHKWMGKKHFCFFQTAETGNRTPNSSVKGSGANHYPMAPAPCVDNRDKLYKYKILTKTRPFQKSNQRPRWKWHGYCVDTIILGNHGNCGTMLCRSLRRWPNMKMTWSGWQMKNIRLFSFYNNHVSRN